MDSVLLYDRECPLCRWVARLVARHDKHGMFVLAPLNSALGVGLCRAWGLNPDGLDTLVVIQNGRALLRGDAVLAVARGLGGSWRVLLLAGGLPKLWRDEAYRWVASRRHRFPSLD